MSDILQTANPNTNANNSTKIRPAVIWDPHRQVIYSARPASFQLKLNQTSGGGGGCRQRNEVRMWKKAQHWDRELKPKLYSVSTECNESLQKRKKKESHECGSRYTFPLTNSTFDYAPFSVGQTRTSRFTPPWSWWLQVRYIKESEDVTESISCSIIFILQTTPNMKVKTIESSIIHCEFISSREKVGQLYKIGLKYLTQIVILAAFFAAVAAQSYPEPAYKTPEFYVSVLFKLI